ncbi:MAG: hypothetical protein E6248_14510 [Clostridium sp.]|uniref:hypothetical protein n=1 Tax=Clostridium sp. TaxID=1506 RepID=UPI002914C7ED|nr:hypothetical protein [Clostridium sp.]MDU5111652.1 hypothetical protein [Clostridium sp.]
MNLIPFNTYLLVMPNGNALGFNDEDLAKAYVNRYYEEKIKEYSQKDDYSDFSDLVGQVRNNICQHIGVDEGRCNLYNLNNFIENLRENLVFDDEKEEIIKKLYEKDIRLNIYDYSLDNILNDTEIIEIIEPYGEV